MLSKYTIIIRDRFGGKYGGVTTIIDDFTVLDLARKKNGVGALDLELPGDFDVTLLEKDGIVEVWRSVGALPAYLEGRTFFFIRKIEKNIDAQGKKTIKVTTEDPISLLQRRVIPYEDDYAPGAPYDMATQLYDFADDMIKTIFDDGYIYNSFYAERDIASDWLVMDAKTASSIEVYKQCSWRGYLDTFQDICNDVVSQGDYLAFDLIRESVAKLRFKTYIDRLGSDKTSLIFSIENGNLVNPAMTTDFTIERNRFYVKGRLVTDLEVMSDPDEYQVSPFSMYEEVVTSGNISGYYYDLEAEGRAAIQKNRPKRKLVATLADVPSCVFGVDYGYGDTISVRYDGALYACHLDAYSIRVEGGKETIKASVEAELTI